MKLTTIGIRVLTDFEYGRNKGLNLIASLFSFATFMEVTKVDRKWYIVLIPSALILTWVWGIFLRKINFRKREAEFINKENPMLMDIHKSVKR